MSEAGGVPLPSGVVSILFTDVEGSTRLWAADADAMSASLRLHDELTRGAVRSRGGYVFATAGDSFAVAFSHATAAVDAAVDLQRAFASASWPGPELRVRMGLHLGEAEERGGDYFGPVINACARVEASGHGGQVLLTDAIAAVVGGHELVDLGEHQLRDLPAPIRLFQVGPGEFGPLRGIVGARDTLPQRRTRLLGRDREVTSVRSLVTEQRLVTLVGPGGIGKTSLAIESVGGLSAAFPGGLHFADLAQANEPDVILAAMCRAVQLTATDPYRQLCDHLAGRPTLVIVDNCEHLIDDVAELVDQLLADVGSLHLLATSREHLDLDGEHVVTVGPLVAGVDSAAVRLFVERVIATSPDFQPTAGDLETISAICQRLDGMPLAIELAAGRTRSMGLADIERGLSDRFTLLAGSRRGKLRRQQTLRATIDWSIDLLSPDERRLLARLAVISGPFALDVASAVGEGSPRVTGDLVASLVAKSLVQRALDVGGEARFHLLETVREWGLDELDRLGEIRAVRDLHAAWYLSSIESLGPVEFSGASSWSVPTTRSIVDAVAAADHLRGSDVTGAALIIAGFSRGIAESGLGPIAQDIQREARAAGWTRCTCRLWAAEHGLIMDLAQGFPFDDLPPPDDGTFEWRFLVGGERWENAGLLGWYRSWVQPRALIDEFRALGPVAEDSEALAIRAHATANAVHALTHLGHFEEAIAAYEESGELWRRAGTGRAGVGTEPMAVASAAIVLGLDLRDTPAGEHAAGWTLTNQNPLFHLAAAVILEAPDARRRAVATAARASCDGRYPGDESAYLAVLGYYALDDDPQRALALVESTFDRSPGGPVLKRLVRLRAQGQPPALLGDEAHYLAQVAADFDPPALMRSRIAENRRKLDAEVARILD